MGSDGDFAKWLKERQLAAKKQAVTPQLEASKPAEAILEGRGKVCPRCGQEYDMSEFGVQGKYSGYCKECKNAYSKELYIIKKNRELGICPICGQQGRLVMDHDHKTKKLRDWICRGCNLGLGGFRDNVESLLKAIEYLKTERT